MLNHGVDPTSLSKLSITRILHCEQTRAVIVFVAIADIYLAQFGFKLEYTSAYCDWCMPFGLCNSLLHEGILAISTSNRFGFCYGSESIMLAEEEEYGLMSDNPASARITYVREAVPLSHTKSDVSMLVLTGGKFISARNRKDNIISEYTPGCHDIIEKHIIAINITFSSYEAYICVNGSNEWSIQACSLFSARPWDRYNRLAHQL